jgi:hypothetical protein
MKTLIKRQLNQIVRRMSSMIDVINAGVPIFFGFTPQVQSDKEPQEAAHRENDGGQYGNRRQQNRNGGYAETKSQDNQREIRLLMRTILYFVVLERYPKTVESPLVLLVVCVIAAIVSQWLQEQSEHLWRYLKEIFSRRVKMTLNDKITPPTVQK